MTESPVVGLAGSRTDLASAGERFARALAATDRAGLLAALAPDVEFRGLTPRRAWSSESAEEVVDDIVFGTWFAEPKVIQSLESVATDRVAQRGSVTYRLLIDNDGEPHVCEQHAYYEVSDGRISWLRILCSGILPR